MPRTKPPKLRPEVEQALRARHEGAPHVLTGFAWMSKFAELGLERRQVPSASWKREDRDGVSCAVVSCPCGRGPGAELAAYPAPCECERWFFYDGTDVWALNTPKSTPSA